MPSPLNIMVRAIFSDGLPPRAYTVSNGANADPSAVMKAPNADPIARRGLAAASII